MIKNEFYVVFFCVKLKKKGWILVVFNESLEMRLNFILEIVYMKIIEIIN